VKRRVIIEMNFIQEVYAYYVIMIISNPI